MAVGVNCLIEGCTRSTGRDVGDEWFCRHHWRIGCPPRSPERRAYNRFWSRYGEDASKWPVDVRRRFWRFWNALAARARRRCAGDVDMAEDNIAAVTPYHAD